MASGSSTSTQPATFFSNLDLGVLHPDKILTYLRQSDFKLTIVKKAKTIATSKTLVKKKVEEGDLRRRKESSYQDVEVSDFIVAWRRRGPVFATLAQLNDEFLSVMQRLERKTIRVNNTASRTGTYATEETTSVRKGPIFTIGWINQKRKQQSMEFLKISCKKAKCDFRLYFKYE